MNTRPGAPAGRPADDTPARAHPGRPAGNTPARPGAEAAAGGRSLTLGELGDWVGREVGVSAWLRVDQARIDAFADATGDRQWIHVDPRRAAQSPYGGTIAHGLLTLSLVPGMRAEAVRLEGVAAAINYGMNRVRFMAPVRAGSELRSRFLLRSAEPAGEGLLLTWQATVEIQGQDKPACVAEMLVLVLPARA